MNRKLLSTAASRSLATFALAAAASGAAPGCGADEEQPPGPRDPQAVLQALLHDGPAVQAPPGATVPRDSSSARVGPALAASGPPIGMWRFDDCTPTQTQLFDSTLSGNTAFRSVGVGCATGVQAGGVELASVQDIVYVPDQPAFTFERGTTVAAWLKPDSAGGTRTLLRKRDGATSSFALLLNAGRLQLVVNLGPDNAFSVSSPSPAEPGRFQHVAGTYDGMTLRLYVDGSEVAAAAAPGAIARGPGPLLIGNDASERRFDGVIDVALFATHALTADEIQALTCFPVLPTLAISPDPIPTTPRDQPVAIDIAVTNHNPPKCAPITVTMNIGPAPDLALDPPPFSSTDLAIANGETGRFRITATPRANPGTTVSFPLLVLEPTSGLFADERVSFEVSGTECHVSTSRELMITQPSVVDDPVRTVFTPGSADPRNGIWTFKHLVEEMAATPADAPAMVEAMLATFDRAQTINGFTVAARPGMQQLIVAGWPRTAGGELDLARAPFKLQAIVNRFDLRDLAAGDAGEGRFVFAFHAPGSPFPFQATIIFEYKLPAATEQAVLGWAKAFHALGALPPGEAYNAALQGVTEQFARRGARPGRPNGSAINAVRTNEISFAGAGLWELRQFGLSAASGRLEPTTVERTPAVSFNSSETLASYITANRTEILAERHVVPDRFASQPFAAGAIANNLGTWFAPAIDSDTRHRFAVNTCNGCHSAAETNTVFLHIVPRPVGEEARLSSYLTGTTVNDPVTDQPRTFNELARRKADLEAIVCDDPAAAGGSAARLRKGVTRVH